MQTVEENIFFLFRHGGGSYSDAVRKWPIDRFKFHVDKLMTTMKAEQEARDQAMRQRAKRMRRK